MIENKAIGNNIKAAREKAEMSQKELAEKMGIAQPRISRWEKGEFIPNGRHLSKLAIILEVTVDELMNGLKAGD